MDQQKKDLLALLISEEVLQFGDFVLKSGRQSPYFFNLGAINSGVAITALGEAYAQTIIDLDFSFDTLFGPAYKGIPIAVSAAQALARRGLNSGWAFNRKEAKTHGEGGQFVGASVQGRVLLVDDVLTAGTALREAAGLITAAGGQLVGVVIALDRQELLDGETAVENLSAELGIPVASIITLQDVIEYLDLIGRQDNHSTEKLAEVKAYQAEYCQQGSAG
jgi:orotate phosphoribosyltransferase